jgi:hypothetical protein
MNGAPITKIPESPRWRWGLWTLAGISIAACGSPTPPTAPPAAKAEPTVPATPLLSPEPAPAAPPSTVPSSEPAAPSPPPAEAAPTTEGAPVRSLGDRLFARTISFMLNYNASPAKEKVANACAPKTGEDSAAQAACIEKERAKLVADVLLFEKGEKGTILRTFKRTGNQLIEVNTAQIDVAGDSPEKIELKIKSESGPRQLFAGKKRIVVLSESDSSIALDDPQLGKLVYDARVGLVGQ